MKGIRGFVHLDNPVFWIVLLVGVIFFLAIIASVMGDQKRENVSPPWPMTNVVEGSVIVGQGPTKVLVIHAMYD